MQCLTLERIHWLDQESSGEIHAVLGQVRLSTLFHEDNGSAIKTLAIKLDLPVNELCSYIWLQAYVQELSESFGDVLNIEHVAQQFGIDPQEFDEYVRLRSERLHAEHQNFMDEVEAAELAGRGFSLEEWNSYLEDLQEDASLQSD